MIVQTALRVELAKVKLEKVANPEELAFTVWLFVPQPLTVAVTETVVPPGAKLAPDGSIN